MRKTVVLAAVGAVAVVLAGWAFFGKPKEGWSLVGETAEGKYYADLSTVITHGHVKRVWTKSEPVDSSKDGVLFKSTLEEFDCAERKSRFLEAVYYKTDGTHLSSKSASDWYHVNPGTLGAAFLKATCS